MSSSTLTNTVLSSAEFSKNRFSVIFSEFLEVYLYFFITALYFYIDICMINNNNNNNNNKF